MTIITPSPPPKKIHKNPVVFYPWENLKVITTQALYNNNDTDNKTWMLKNYFNYIIIIQYLYVTYNKRKYWQYDNIYKFTCRLLRVQRNMCLYADGWHYVKKRTSEIRRYTCVFTCLHIYIYMCVCMCVCVCVILQSSKSGVRNNSVRTNILFKFRIFDYSW